MVKRLAGSSTQQQAERLEMPQNPKEANEQSALEMIDLFAASGANRFDDHKKHRNSERYGTLTARNAEIAVIKNKGRGR